MRENPQTQDSTGDLPYCFILYQKSNMILWSIRTFWYKGSAENKNKQTCSHKKIYLSNTAAKTQSRMFRKSLDMVEKRLILARYPIILHIKLSSKTYNK